MVFMKIHEKERKEHDHLLDIVFHMSVKLITIFSGRNTRNLCSDFNVAMFLHFINGSCNRIPSNFRKGVQLTSTDSLIMELNNFNGKYNVSSSRFFLGETPETPGMRKLQAVQRRKMSNKLRVDWENLHINFCNQYTCKNQTTFKVKFNIKQTWPEP